MPQTFDQYIGCCVDFHNRDEEEKRKLNEMIDNGRDVTYETFTRHVPVIVIASIFPGYAWGKGEYPGQLRLKKDWHVRFRRSTFGDKPCYFIVHSAIEYIFVER